MPGGQRRVAQRAAARRGHGDLPAAGTQPREQAQQPGLGDTGMIHRRDREDPAGRSCFVVRVLRVIGRDGGA